MENGTVSSNKFPQPGDQVSSLSNYASNGKIMLFSGVILFAAIIVVLFFHSSARWIFHLRRRYALSLPADSAASRGLDPSILKALPVLIYSAKAHAPSLECAVCLSEFQDGEEGRVLPACKHTFHSCCIDMWFCSHSNCPLCRSPVQSGGCKARAETVVPVVEAADSRRKEGNERFCSAYAAPAPASLSPLQCEKIGPDLVGILVERPTISGSGPSSQVEPKPTCEKLGLDL